MKAEPLISVIVPAYCHADYVVQCLESIYAQTYRPIELIVVDDASADQTYERCSALFQTAFTKRFQKVELIRNDENHGAHASINRGIAASNGALVSIINSDDSYHPDRLEVLVDELRATNSELAFSLVDIQLSAGISQVPEEFRLFTLSQMLALRRDVTVGFSLLRRNQATSTGNLVFTRQLYQNVGPFLPLKYCHDWDFVLQSLHFTEPAVVHDKLYNYRIHSANSFADLSHVAEVETEIVLRRFFRRGLMARPRNKLCPSAARWPGYFELFIKECGYSALYDVELGLGLKKWRVYSQAAVES